MTVEAQASATERVPLDRLRVAEHNPRLIRDTRFKQLCKSLESDPDFLWQRPVLADMDGLIYAGAMRYLAAKHLGWSHIAARLSDVDEATAKRRMILDNQSYGEYVDHELAELLGELQQSGADLDALGFDDKRIDELLDSVGLLGEPTFAPAGEEEQGRLDQRAPVVCPECGHEFVPKP